MRDQKKETCGRFVHLIRLDKGDKRKILSRKFDPDVVLAISGAFCRLGLHEIRQAPSLRQSPNMILHPSRETERDVDFVDSRVRSV